MKSHHHWEYFVSSWTVKILLRRGLDRQKVNIYVSLILSQYVVREICIPVERDLLETNQQVQKNYSRNYKYDFFSFESVHPPGWSIFPY